MNISIDELRNKTDEEVINLLKQYPYPSQWENQESLAHAEYTLALVQGKKYQKTGNINSFKAECQHDDKIFGSYHGDATLL